MMRGRQTNPGPAVSDPLETLFRPRSIAVVGASANQRTQGYEFVQGLIEIGFPGPIYPVNPKLDELLGLKAYPRLEAIPGPVDFVISAVPAGAALDVVDGARAKGAKLIHFFTARFGETGREDAAALEQELGRRIREAGIRVIGPNCMGLYYPKEKITFDPVLPVDPDTEVIAAYIEGVRDGRRFLDALRRAAARKPVVVLKGGRTAAGRTAAASHTASMASQQAVWQAAIRQAGAIEVDSLNELIDMLVAFCLAGPANGPRVAVLGGAGGETVETADLCHEAGLDVAPLPQELREALRDKLPHAWDWVGNPVDGSILGWGRSEALDVIRLMAASPAYDLIFANARGVEHMLNQEDGDKLFRGAIDLLKRLGTGGDKAPMPVRGERESREERRGKAVMDARHELAAAGVAVYPDIERAA